ncbi:MAG: GNAT family N-acetyltransferase [Anaerolineae bacterium]|nr:GNAT family N-acetyltransferase [Anaerolineae bacterium]
MSLQISPLTNRDVIRDFLNHDRDLTAYALGDLDDAFWPDSEFIGAEQNGELAAILLMYRGLDPTVVTGFGEPDAVRAILNTVTLPEQIYYLLQPALEPLLAAEYDLSHRHPEWRMVLDAGAFDPPSTAGVSRLGPEHAGTLAALFRHAADPGEEIAAFSPWQLAHGMFFGVWDGSELVATAGTHVWSPAERVTAIGNVFTLPACRGRGYATQCTAAVAVEALAADMDPVVLNVRAGNDPALRVYEKLGFRRYVEFMEGPALRRSR